jgi:two-component system, NarL family, nitrate/nitrite response regulator NarL
VSRTRILVADPLRIFRAGVRDVLLHEGDFQVLEAGSLDEVLDAIGDRCPDIALVDLDLPPLGGLAAVERLAESCTAHVVVWSLEPTREAVFSAVRAGAHGFLRKGIAPRDLVRSLRAAGQGQAPLPPDLATLLIDALHDLDERARARERASVLSLREREVLDHIARGAHNKQIARALTISEFTVKRHVQNILHKLEVPSRKAAAMFYETAFDGEEAPSSAAQLA